MLAGEAVQEPKRGAPGSGTVCPTLDCRQVHLLALRWPWPSLRTKNTLSLFAAASSTWWPRKWENPLAVATEFAPGFPFPARDTGLVNSLERFLRSGEIARRAIVIRHVENTKSGSCCAGWELSGPGWKHRDPEVRRKAAGELVTYTHFRGYGSFPGQNAGSRQSIPFW
jgi:hypothetical protein